MITRLFILLFISLLLLPAAAWADDFVEPTDEQFDLNDQGVEALLEGNFDEATRLLRQAYDLGPINILGLNLGRAYQRAGDCEQARAILEGISELPAVEAPASDAVNERADDYLRELDETCPVDEVEEPVEEFEDDVVDIGTGTVDPVEPPANPYALWGWTSIGAGSALAITGGVFFLSARSQRAQVTGDDSFENGLNTRVTQREALEIESRANLFDTIALGTTITGALAIGLGIYLLVDGHSLAEGSAFSFTAQPGYQGLSWTTSF